MNSASGRVQKMYVTTLLRLIFFFHIADHPLDFPIAIPREGTRQEKNERATDDREEREDPGDHRDLPSLAILRLSFFS